MPTEKQLLEFGELVIFHQREIIIMMNEVFGYNRDNQKLRLELMEIDKRIKEGPPTYDFTMKIIKELNDKYGKSKIFMMDMVIKLVGGREKVLKKKHVELFGTKELP